MAHDVMPACYWVQSHSGWATRELHCLSPLQWYRWKVLLNSYVACLYAYVLLIWLSPKAASGDDVLVEAANIGEVK